MAGSEIIRHLPNLVTWLRILLVPVFLAFAITGHPWAFLVTVAAGFLSDLLDGLLARALGQTSEFGAKLDSLADFTFYLTIPLGAWWLWPDILHREALFFAAVIASITVPPLAALVKFRALSSYHTWGAKLAALLVGLSLLTLFGLELAWPFRIAAGVSVLAAIEEVGITLILPKPRSNVRTFWHVVKARG